MKILILILSLCPLFVLTAVGQTNSVECPAISVLGPQGITAPGDVLVLRAQISGIESGTTLTYDWKVSNGRILDGQTRDHISVQITDADAGSSITATVLVKGLSEKCPNSASDYWVVMQRTDDPVIDQYGRVPWRDEQARLDNFHVQILHNPNYTGYIYMQIADKGSVYQGKKHARKIVIHFKRRDKSFDLSRLQFAIDRRGESPSTSFYIFPKGSKVPLCSDSCVLLNAKEL